MISDAAHVQPEGGRTGAAVPDEGDRPVFATLVSSGRAADGFGTPTGSFRIRTKHVSATMDDPDGGAEAYSIEDVPWTMYFDGARALHGAYWRTRFGYPQSHGCVNLSTGDSHWLFNWAVEGDWVYVHDPTGLTPTDPSLYSDYAY